jgi:uncharacterized protein (DUF2147 family)
LKKKTIAGGQTLPNARLGRPRPDAGKHPSITPQSPFKLFVKTLPKEFAVRLGLAFVFIVAGSGFAMADPADQAFGVWRHPENGSHVEMSKCGAGLCAKIVSIEDGQKTDDKNPDPALRGRPIVGLPIMTGAKKTGPESWSGSLYNRADGKTYAGTITVRSPDTLDLAGCVLSVFCKTLTWTRVKTASGGTN